MPAATVGEIVANLLENAFATAIRRRFGALDRLESDQLQLAVWDSGPLIDLEERERIFRRGERGRHGAKLSGTGLGWPWPAIKPSQRRQLATANPCQCLGDRVASGGECACLKLPLSSAAAASASRSTA